MTGCCAMIIGAVIGLCLVPVIAAVWEAIEDWQGRRWNGRGGR